MKRHITSILAAAALLPLSTSCNSFLEQTSPSTYEDENVYTSYQLSESAIFGIIETFAEQNSYRGRFLPWYGFNTDIEWYNNYKPGDGKYDIAAYECEVNNSQMNTASNGATNNPWALMYSGIERANLVLEGLEKYGDIQNRSEMAYLYAEALTLRSMIYYDLIKAWGDVPARFEPVTASTIYINREDRDLIFKQILKDLDTAIPLLPNPGASTQTSRTDRINKVFAEGLYARIALAAAGSALRPDKENGEKAGTGCTGKIGKTNDPELSAEVLYPKALSYLQAAITSGTASLEPDFATYWYQFNNMQNMTAGPSYETLYVIPFGDGRGRWNFTFAISSEGASISGGVSRGGDVGPVPTLYYKYDAQDKRRDITCVNYKWQKDGTIVPAGISTWYFGKFRFEWMDVNPYTGGNDDGIKPVVMRYADILMMAAEIEGETGSLSKAKDYIRPVMNRAYGEDLAGAKLDAVNNPTDFHNLIKNERAFEFCGEFLRKGDLIRWGELKSSLDQAKSDMKDLRTAQGDYSFLAGRTQVWYQTSEDNESITIWGLNPEETDKPAGDWEVVDDYLGEKSYNDAKKTGFHLSKIEGIYLNDPERRMFWPIFSCNITDSQSTLVNDYDYK